MPAHFILILNFLITFSLGWGIYFGILYGRGWLYTKKTILVSAYFGLVYILSYLLLFNNFYKGLLFSICVILGVYSYTFFRKIVGLTIREKYLFAKVFEILYQQVLIYALILIFLNYSAQYLYFGLLFGIVHIPILFIKYIGRMRFVYFCLSFIGGYLFIFLTNEYRYGYYLAYLLHYSFYVAVGKSIPERVLKRF